MSHTDIESRKQIEQLVDTFYNKVLVDPQIGYIFKEVIDTFWDKHVLIMYDFWESVLFHTAKYKGNPMIKHIELNKRIPLRVDHFNQWTFLWNQTIDELFVGPNATSLKEKAESMKLLMMYKIKESSKPNFIQ